MSADYLDASAIVKLIVVEPETEALRDHLRNAPAQGVKAVFSSRLGHAEVIRAVRRRSPELWAKAREVLQGVHWVGISDAVIVSAGQQDPRSLRTLDALHLATALQEASALRHMVAYDERLIQACQQAGLSVLSPGT